MANIASQEKRIHRAERERIENRRYTSAIKTYFRRLQTAVGEGDDDAANAEHRQLVALIDKAVKRGALHRNTGARKKSRAARLRTAAPEAAPAKSTAKASSTKASAKGTAKPAADEGAAEKPSTAKSSSRKTSKASSAKGKAAEKAPADKSE
jgi:small subunit ribosomal protein S20